MAQVFIQHAGSNSFMPLGNAHSATAGYSSLRNLQATLLWRWRATKPHSPKWMTTPSRAYKTEKGVRIVKWSNCTQSWREECVIVWRD